MTTLKKSFVLLFIFQQVNGFLSDMETIILLKTVKYTYVRNCFLAPKEIADSKAVELIKLLSEHHVFTVFLSRENILPYLNKTDMTVFRWTAVVLKEESLNTLNIFSNKGIISLFFWILFDGSNGTLRNELLLTEIPLNTAFVLVENLNGEDYLISEFYSIKKQFPGVIHHLLKWKNGSSFSFQKNWYDRKSNMQNYEFTTVKFNESLYLIPKEKVNEVLWEEMSQLLNFTIKTKFVPYHQYNETQEFDLNEEEEALLDTQIYIGNNNKFRYLLGPTSQSGLYMHVKAEGEYKGLNRFLKPFTKYTWLGIGYWACFCGLFEFLVEYLSRKFGCSEKPPKEAFANAFTPLYFVCNQNGLDTSSNLSSRIILFLIRISAAATYYAYAATFISYLLLYIPQLPFTDLKGFVEDGTYRIIAERNSEVDTYFKVSSQSLERLVYMKFLSDVTKWSRLDKEVDRMCGGEKLVLVAYDNDGEKYKPCNIVKIKKPLKVFANGFKLRFKSPFRGLLHIKLLLLRNTGILWRINHNIINQNFQTFVKNDTYEISMEKVSSVFMLLGYGILVSAGVLLLEIIFANLTGFYCKTQKT